MNIIPIEILSPKPLSSKIPSPGSGAQLLGACPAGSAAQPLGAFPTDGSQPTLGLGLGL